MGFDNWWDWIAIRDWLILIYIGPWCVAALCGVISVYTYIFYKKSDKHEKVMDRLEKSVSRLADNVIDLKENMNNIASGMSDVKDGMTKIGDGMFSVKEETEKVANVTSDFHQTLKKYWIWYPWGKSKF